MKETQYPYSRLRTAESDGEEKDFGRQDHDDQEPLLGKEDGVPIMLSVRVKDKYNLVFLIFYLLGLGGLLPWNFFINAQDYWMYKFRNCNSTVNYTTVPSAYISGNRSVAESHDVTPTHPPSGEAVTSLQSLFMNSLAVCAMLPSLIFQFLNTIFQRRISQNVRVVFSLVMMVVLFVFTEIMVKVDTCSWQETFFVVTLISIVLINSFAAISQSSVFGIAAELPQKYCGGYMAGQGMGGLFASVAMLVALACSGGPSDSAFIFFLVAILVLTMTVFAYLLLTKLDFYKNTVLLARTCPTTNTVQSFEEFDEHRILVPPDEENSSSRATMLRVSKKLALHLFCVMYVFFITLACFPAVTGKIKSKNSGNEWTDKYFEPVTCYLVFNFGDWLGRTSASYIHIPSSTSNWKLLFCVLARTAFPVLFALCNYRPRHHLPVIIHEDWIYIVIMVLFAISNGHLSTLSMQYGPKQVEPEDCATAGSMLAFFMTAGLLLGAGASFLLTSWI